MSTGNTKYGNSALASNIKKNGNNSAFGISALRDSTNQNNTSFGAYAGTFTTTGQSNVSVGTNSLLKNTTGSYNTALGTATMCFNETGTNNTAVGSNALENNKADYNTAVGTGAMFTNTTGERNTTVGYQALYSNTTGQSNTAVGYQALQSLASGDRNVAVGDLAIQSSTLGSNNVAVGFHALRVPTSCGNNNIAIGSQASEYNTGDDNVAVGGLALFNKTSGNANIAIGAHSIEAVTNFTGSKNVGVGRYSLYSLTGNANANTGIGDEAGKIISSGTNNTMLGYYSGYSLTTGSNNTFLGSSTDVSGNSISYSTAIGYNSKVTENNQIMMGTSQEKVVIPGSAVLTTQNPNYIAESIVPKSYVDSVAGGLTPTEACQCATTGDISLNGIQTIDGYQTKVGDRVLVKNQGSSSSSPIKDTNNIANGIYDVSSGSWTRASDCSGNDVIGQLCFIENGGTNGFKAYSQISNPSKAGTDPLQYSLFYSSNFTAGNGLDVSNNKLNVKSELYNFLTFIGINRTTKNSNYALDVSGNTNISGTLDISGSTPSLSLTNGTKKFVVNSSGQVAIGKDMSSPSIYALDVSGNTNISGKLDISGNLRVNTDKFSVTPTASNVSVSVTIPDTSYNTIENNSGFLLRTSDSSFNCLYFGASYTDNYSYIQSAKSSVGTSDLILNARGGNVGIGTNAPTYKLDVSGNTRVSATLDISGSTPSLALTSGTRKFYVNNSGQVAIAKDSITSGYALDVSGNTNISATLDISGSTPSLALTSGTRKFYVNNSGQVAIAKDSITSGYALDVSGNTNISATLDISGSTPSLALTSGTRKFYVNNSGQVAIAKDSITSGYALDVSGNTNISATLDISGSTPSLALTSGTRKFYVDSSGKVAIAKNNVTGGYALDVSGNTNISATLDISGSTPSLALTSGTRKFYVNNSGQVAIAKDSITSGYALDVSGNTNISATLDISGSTPSLALTSGTRKFYVNNSGQVAIAKDSITSGYALDVSGNTNISATLDISGSTPSLALTSGTRKFYVDSSGKVAIAKNNVTGGYALDVSGNTNISATLDISGSTPSLALTSGTRKFYVNNSGQVAIAKDSITSGYALDVSGNTNISATLDISGSTPSLALTRSGTKKFLVDSSGNVAIAKDTITPNCALDVSGNTSRFIVDTSGNIKVLSGSDNKFYVDSSGNVTAYSYNAKSDYRIKENVTTLDSKFTVDNLRPVTYTNKISGNQDIGFIAHELQEHFPFLVKGEKDGEHNQSVNYIGLIGLLVKEIQELKKKIN